MFKEQKPTTTMHVRLALSPDETAALRWLAGRHSSAAALLAGLDDGAIGAEDLRKAYRRIPLDGGSRKVFRSVPGVDPRTSLGAKIAKAFHLADCYEIGSGEELERTAEKIVRKLVG